MKFRRLLLALLSALLLALPWYTPFSGMLLWVALVPLLVLEADFARRRERGCWKYYALVFLLWNAVDTFWLYRTTLAGAIGAVTGNALQMFLIFALFRFVKKKTGDALGYTFLVALWLAWEAFYYHAEISWPWLVLGNGFAKDIHLIQWYEYTGVLGGSLWVWLVNLSVFYFLTARRTASTKARRVWQWSAFALLLAVPVAVSLVRFYTYEEKHNPCRVVLLQPNIDPHSEKFGSMTVAEQSDILLQLAAAADSLTDYVVAPETAMGRVSLRNLQSDPIVRRLQRFTAQYPHLNFVTGLESIYRYAPGEMIPAAARVTEYGAYDYFNSSLHVNRTDTAAVYHKSKLVILVEKTPYPEVFAFLNRLSIDLGGYVGNCGTQEERVAFASADRRFRMGTAICYESVYGEFYTGYVRKGANVMSIITNDGWWGNTSGYRQHLSFASLRAIETRRSIARSANTGISATINQRGEITARTAWWQRCSLAGVIHANDYETFYVKHGDYLGRLATFVLLLVSLATVVRMLLRRVRTAK